MEDGLKHIGDKAYVSHGGAEDSALPGHTEPTEDDRINLGDYFRVLLKYRLMILVICAVVVAVTAGISLLSPKFYAATTSVVPPIDLLQQQSELTGAFGFASSPMLKKAIGVTSIANLYVGLLKSHIVEDAIIDRFDLVKVYGVAGREKARRRLRRYTRVKSSDDNILRITVKDRRRERAAAMANAFVEELDRQNKRLSAGSATSKRIFLGNRLKEIEEKLAGIDNMLSREAKLQEMLYEMLTKEYEIAKIEEAKSMPTIQVLDKAVPPEHRMARGTVKKMLLAAVVSLVLGVAAAFLREYLFVTGSPAK